MGQFDDLIPKQNAFSDLTPQKKTAAAPSPSAAQNKFSDLIPKAPSEKAPLVKAYQEIVTKTPGAPIRLGEAVGRGDFSKAAEEAVTLLRTAGEVAPAVPAFIPFNVATNVAEAAQNKPTIKNMGAAALKALPFGKAVVTAIKEGPKAVLQQESLTEPVDLKAPRQVLYNAIKAVKPDFKEPEGFLPNLAADIAGGTLTGSPGMAASKLSKAMAADDLLRATKSLKTNPERVSRLRLTENSRKFEKYYTPDESLAEAEKPVQEAAKAHFLNNPAKAVKDYQSRVNEVFGTDKVVSGDEAKFIVPGVNPDTMRVVHEPASAFAKVYRDRLIKSSEGDRIIVMGGGSGAGKSTVVKNLARNGDLSSAKAVLDTNSNNFKAGVKNIEFAKDKAGKAVFIYVEAEPVTAWGRVIKRGLDSGRPVPADVHVTNQGARETVIKLAEKYADDPNVEFLLYDNSGPKGSIPTPIGLEDLKKIRYSTNSEKEALREALDSYVENQIKTGQLTEAQARPFFSKDRRFQKVSSADVPKPSEKLEGIPGQSAQPKPAINEVQQLNDEISKLIYDEAVSLRDFGATEKGGEVLKDLKIRTSLPKILKHPLTGKKPINAKQWLELAEYNLRRGEGQYSQEFAELDEALRLVKGDRPFKMDTGQAGFIRTGKDFEGMSEDEVIKEIQKLREKALGEGRKERKFIRTVRETPKTKKEVGQQILGTYEPITNKGTLALAKARVAANVDDAVAFVKNTSEPTAESNATAQLLIDKFQNAGEYQRAIDIVEDIAAKATKQGQAIQALSIYSRLSPEGVLRYAQRTISKARAANPKAKIPDLTPDVAQRLTELAKEMLKANTPRQRAVATARTLKQIQQLVPPTFLSRISAIQTMMQLLNPKTAIRNLVGNAGFNVIENVSDATAAAFDKAVSLVTKQRTKMMPNLQVQARGFVRGAKEAIQDIREGVRTAPGSTQFEIKQGLFKDPILSRAEKVLRYELEVADRAFFKAAYRNSLLSQLKAAGIKRPTEAMKERAVYDGLYRTFQDDNVISKGFSKIKQALNTLSTGSSEFGLGDAMIKYPKTPGAILARGIDYSPAGFVKTVFELAQPLIGQPFNQRNFVESAARAFVGSTGLVGTGWIMAKLGLVTGRKKDKPGIRDLKREVGLGDYQLNISGLKRFVLSGMDPKEAAMKPGDTLVTYDWFQPQSIAAAIGADIATNGPDKGTAGAVANFLNGMAAGANTLAQQPLVSGLSRAFGYGDLVGGIGEIVKGVPASFVPTLANQVRMLVDDIRRNPDSEDPIKESLNMVKMKLPGLSKDVPAREKPLGGESRIFKAGETPGEKAANAFLNPANTSKFATDPDSDLMLELIRLDVPVGKQGKSLKGIELTEEEIKNIQKEIGPATRTILRALIKTKGYTGLDDFQKEKILEKAMNAGRKVAQAKNVLGIAKRLTEK